MAIIDTSQGKSDSTSELVDASVPDEVTAAAEPTKPRGFFGRRWKTFTDMPWLVRLSTLWLLIVVFGAIYAKVDTCLLYTSPSPRDATLSRMPSSA